MSCINVAEEHLFDSPPVYLQPLSAECQLLPKRERACFFIDKGCAGDVLFWRAFVSLSLLYQGTGAGRHALGTAEHIPHCINLSTLAFKIRSNQYFAEQTGAEH